MVHTRLEGTTLLKAKKLLNDLVDYLEIHDIDYHLEGGTLLGFVRDGRLLEWDHDIDISIPCSFTGSFYARRYKLWLKGYRITRRYSPMSAGPINKGSVRIYKVKRIFHSFLSLFSKSARGRALVADVFIKFCDGNECWWIAKEKLMKVPALHYDGFENVKINGRSYRAPSAYDDYLTIKYGDWSQPVREWDCSRDEKSIVGSIV